MGGVGLWWLWLACAPGDPAPGTGDSGGADSEVPTHDTATSTEPAPTSTEPTEPTEPTAPCTEPPKVLTLTEPGADWAAGDPAVLVHGIQGGWHIGVGGEARGPRDLDMHASVVLVSTGEQLAGDDNTFRLRLSGHRDCQGTVIGMLAYLDDPPGVDQAMVCSWVGEEVDVTLTLTDPLTGASDALTTRVVTVADPDDDCASYMVYP